MSGVLFLCIIIGAIAALSEEWSIVFLCLILGSCAG
jgi:hypothetical protein